MARPWPHPETGIYWFRKGVPKRLRPLLKKREVKVTLGTRDPAEARLRHAEKAAEIAQQWRLLGDGAPRSISSREAAALAGEFYRELVATHEQEPGMPARWEDELKQNCFATGRGLPRIYHLGWKPGQKLRVYYGNRAKRFLLSRGYVLDDPGFDKFLKAYADALRFASERLLRNANGDFTPDPNAARFPELRPDGQAAVSLRAVWDAYVKEAHLKPSTQKRWRPAVEALEAEFGGDLAKVTTKGLNAWKAKLQESLDEVTVKKVYLAVARVICKQAISDGLLTSNPTAAITLKIKKKSRTRERGFTAEEARKILAATLEPPSRLMTPENAAARRWIPWICAYTGARVNEITQLRESDVRNDNDYDIWVIRITPEAGTVKGDRFRDVPLHPHLIEQGFLKYVQSRQGKPLFYNPRRSRGAKPENPQYKKVGERLGEWVRKQVKITDDRVQPNHGWRHRLKSLGRRVMDPEIRDLIQGHVPRTQGEEYGDTWPDVAYREICKIPRYELASASP